MHMFTCHVRAQNNWMVQLVTILVVHWNTACTSMYDQDGATYSRRLTGKTDIPKKTANLNHTVV